MTGCDVDVAQVCLRIGVPTPVLFAQGPNRRAVRYKAKALKRDAPITVESVGMGIQNAKLHLVPAALAVGMNHHRQANGCAICGEVPASVLIRRRGVGALKHTDAAAVPCATSAVFCKSIVKCIAAAAVVIPLVEIAGVLPRRVEIEEGSLRWRWRRAQQQKNK